MRRSAARWRGRQVLQGRDEGEADALLQHGPLLGVARGGGREGDRVGDGLHPRLARPLSQHERVVDDARRLGAVERPQAPAPLRRERVEADVRGDAVEPCLQRRLGVEAAQSLPGAQHRLLHRVLGVHHRAEHAIAVAGEGGAMLLEVVREVLHGGHGHGGTLMISGGVRGRWGGSSGPSWADCASGNASRRRPRWPCYAAPGGASAAA